MTRLLASTQIEDHEEVLRATNAILKKSKGDHDALHTRAVALLKLDRYEDALRAMDEGGDKLAQRCALEKAYALYKIGQLEEAHKIYAAYSAEQKNAEGARPLAHVAAQAAYRAEQFETAGKLYTDLRDREPKIPGEDNDLRINSLAVDVQLEWQGKGDNIEKSRQQLQKDDLEAFETTYNAACGCVARGDLEAASVLLKRAKDLCEAIDELTEDEKRAEVLPIMVQQAYTLTRLGKIQEAAAIQQEIEIADILEAPTRFIAQNNALASQEQQSNPYLTERLFSSQPPLSKTEQLFSYQSSVMKRNRYAVSLQALKHDGVARSTADIVSEQPLPTTSAYINGVSVVNAAAHTQRQTDKSAIRKLNDLLEKRHNDIGLILTIVQLYVAAHNPGAATATLEALFKRLEADGTPAVLDVRYAPGLIALIVALYRLQGRKSPIKTQLGNAAEYWTKKSTPCEDLLRAAGLSLLESTNPEDLQAAADFFKSLREKDDTNLVAVAGYIAATACREPELVEADLAKLSPVDRLIAGVDVDALEDAGIASLPLTKGEVGRKRSVQVEEKPKKRRVRKSQLPKDYVEGGVMDPERWLPIKDRSSYRPKGKKGKKKMMDSTQGGVVSDEVVQLTEGAGVVKVQSAPKQNKKKKGKK